MVHFCNIDNGTSQGYINVVSSPFFEIASDFQAIGRPHPFLLGSSIAAVF